MYLVIFFSLVICMLACHTLARKKGLNAVAWGLTGAVLGPLALVALLFVPSKNE